MNIHHKFVALFDATPGAYANTPSLDDTNLLLDFIETVTGVDVTEDSDFIDHVLTNMGFVQDENSDLWDTAHGAMTGLVSANGRASAVDTAIQFLEVVGLDTSSDYYRPAYRLIQKAAGSVVATEANNNETDVEVLKAVFVNAEYGWLDNLGELNTDNSVLTVDHRLTTDTAQNSSLTPFGDSYETVNAEGSLLLGSVSTLNADRLRYDNSSLTQNKTINLSGEGPTQIRTMDEFAVMAKFENSTINLLNGNSTVAIGNGQFDNVLDDTDPVALLKLINSTMTGLNTSNNLLIGLNEGGNGAVNIIGSELNGFHDIRVGFGNSENVSVPNVPTGNLTATNSTLFLSGDLTSGSYGGLGDIQLNQTTATIGEDLEVGTASGGLPANSNGSVVIGASSNITVSGNINAGHGKGATGEIGVTDSTISTAGQGIYIAQNYAPDWEAVSGDQNAVGTMSLTNSTITTTNGSLSPTLMVGRGDLSVGTLQLSGSTISGLQSMFVGNDHDSSSTPDQGGQGTVTLAQQSSLNFESTTRPSYFAIGRDGGTGSVILDASSLTQTSSIQASEGAFAGDYYSGAHVGRNASSLISDSAYEGSLTLQNNSTVAQTSHASSNVNPYLTVGRDDGANGKVEILSGSSWTLSASNSDLLLTVVTIGNSTGSTGLITVDGIGSELMVSGSTAQQKIVVGSGGSGELRVTNGGQVHLHTTRPDQGDQVGNFIIGEFSDGSGTLFIDGANSLVMGDQFARMSIGEMPELMYASGNTADTYAGTSGSVAVSNEGSLRVGTAGDGIPDIFVGNGGSLIASDDSTVVGDIQIIGTGTVSDNLLAYVI